MTEVFAACRPHAPEIQRAANAVNLPVELIRHQMIVTDQCADPANAARIANAMRVLFDKYLQFRSAGLSWRDIYGLAALDFNSDESTVFKAFNASGDPTWEAIREQIPPELADKIDAPRFSVFWDFENESGWGWFDKNLKLTSLTKKSSPSILIWLGALGIAFLLLKGKKK